MAARACGAGFPATAAGRQSGQVEILATGMLHARDL